MVNENRHEQIEVISFPIYDKFGNYVSEARYLKNKFFDESKKNLRNIFFSEHSLFFAHPDYFKKLSSFIDKNYVEIFCGPTPSYVLVESLSATGDYNISVGAYGDRQIVSLSSVE